MVLAIIFSPRDVSSIHDFDPIREASYRDFVMISPTIISTKPLDFRTTLEFHSSGKVFLVNIQGLFQSIVSEIIVKSFYE